MTDTPDTKPQRKQLSVYVDEDISELLRGYAFGTMRTVTEVLREAIDEYMDHHADDIERQRVVR